MPSAFAYSLIFSRPTWYVDPGHSFPTASVLIGMAGTITGCAANREGGDDREDSPGGGAPDRRQDPPAERPVPTRRSPAPPGTPPAALPRARPPSSASFPLSAS